MRSLLRKTLLLAALPLVSAACREPVPREPPKTPGPIAPAGGEEAPADAPKPAAPDGKAETLSTDTKIELPSGAATTAPKGWSRTARKTHVTLEDPEHDLRLHLVELDVADGPAAIEKAWTIADPERKLAVERTLEPPAQKGWEKITVVDYKEPPDGEHVSKGLAFRGGGHTYVFLVEGQVAAEERRGAQVETMIMALAAPGIGQGDLSKQAAGKLDGKRLAAFEAFVEKAFAESRVPGLALAVVADGKIVYEKGYGVRALGKKDPVGPGTRMMIGSITKSMTTLLMAKLVDEKKLDWEAHVPAVLPGFSLGDPSATEKILVRHTVCACTGMPRRDLQIIMETRGVTPESFVASMKLYKPTTGFGETFQYSNQLVAVGGYAAARVYDPKKKLGEAYDEAMKKLVFEPEGMASSTTSTAEALKSKDFALPHGATLDGAPVLLDMHYEDFVTPLRPAGGVWSTAHDLATYMLTEIGRGKSPSGKVVASEANLTKRWEPGVKIDDRNAYGLGLGVESWHGIRIVKHGGNTIGFSADLAFMPDKGIGLALVTNATGSLEAPLQQIHERLFEILFDLEGGKEQAEATRLFVAKVIADQRAKEMKGIEGTFDAAWRKTFVGTYEHRRARRGEDRGGGQRPLLRRRRMEEPDLAQKRGRRLGVDRARGPALRRDDGLRPHEGRRPRDRDEDAAGELFLGAGGEKEVIAPR